MWALTLAIFAVVFFAAMFIFRLSFWLTERIARTVDPNLKLDRPGWSHAAAVIIALLIYVALSIQFLDTIRDLMLPSMLVDIGFSIGYVLVFVMLTTVVIRFENRIATKYALLTASLFIAIGLVANLLATTALRTLVDKLA